MKKKILYIDIREIGDYYGIRKNWNEFGKKKTPVWVKACGKTSILQTKTIKPIELKGLKFAPLEKDTVEITNILSKGLKNLRNNECIQAATERVNFLQQSDDKILQLIKEKKTNAFRDFDAETFHNDGLLSFIRTKEKDVLNIPKEKMNKYVEQYINAELQFYKYFDDMLFPVSSNKKVLEIEQKLAKMGIDARLTNHEKEAKDIYKACRKMKEAGIENLPKIRLQTHRVCSMGLGSKNPKDGYIILGDTPSPHKDGFVVNSSMEGIVYHETAHVLNSHLKASESMRSYNKSDDFFQTMENNLKNAVSVYSANNPNEACSEIFAGIMSGKKYPKEIIEVLEHYKGYNPSK